MIILIILIEFFESILILIYALDYICEKKTLIVSLYLVGRFHPWTKMTRQSLPQTNPIGGITVSDNRTH
jgi:hypothetical protein